MITKTELTELAKIKPFSQPVISLYLNLEETLNKRKNFLTFLQNQINLLKKNTYEILKNDLKKIQTIISSQDKDTKGLIVFSSGAKLSLCMFRLTIILLFPTSLI